MIARCPLQFRAWSKMPLDADSAPTKGGQMSFLRFATPAVLALLTVLLFDQMSWRRGLRPPAWVGGARPGVGSWTLPMLRRGLALTSLWAVLWIGVFSPLAALGQDSELDLSAVTTPQLFLLHFLFVLGLMIWYVLGFAGMPGFGSGGTNGWIAQLGFRAPSVWREIGIGLVAGVGAWVVVLVILMTVGLVVWWSGGADLLPTEPPAIVPWIAALPVAVRLLVSLSAGVVEETFFRGFLQPRVGLLISSALFVLAHASYEQPLMLVGITLLSLVYGALVIWRQTIWPAIAAHTLFDAMQLLLIIPWALRLLKEGGPEIPLPVAAALSVLGF
jgi:membrane protease YdiL (CAAX protease family)